MTQPVLNVVAENAASVPATGPGASEGGEPTIEELAALVGEPIQEPVKEEPVVAEETAAVEEPPTEGEAAAAAPVDEALERATKAAAKAREGSRRFKETQEQLRITAQREQQHAQEVERLRRETAAARQREEALLKDPYRALKERGMTDEQLARRAMQENSPEALVLRVQEELQAERAARQALETRLAEEREAVRAQAVKQQAEAAFFEAAKDAEAFPELAIRRPAVQLAAARAALAQIEANGFPTRHFTNEQIAEAAEEWLKPTTPKKKAEPVAPPAPVAKPPLAKTSGKTLTNAQAQTRTAAPAGWDALTEEQQIAHLAAQLPEPTG